MPIPEQHFIRCAYSIGEPISMHASNYHITMGEWEYLKKTGWLHGSQPIWAMLCKHPETFNSAGAPLPVIVIETWGDAPSDIVKSEPEAQVQAIESAADAASDFDEGADMDDEDFEDEDDDLDVDQDDNEDDL